MPDLHDHAEDDVPRKPSKGIYILPNLFTLAALFGGFYAIVMAMNEHFEMAAIGVFCAMVLDSLDGRVARMSIFLVLLCAWLDSTSTRPW